MTYERPELVLVDAVEILVLGGIDGLGEGTGTPPHERVSPELVAGLDD